MFKKLLALFVTMAMAVTLFSGCKPGLSPEEYRDELSACWKCYLDAQLEFAVMATEPEEADFARFCEDFENSLDAFEKITPPEQYSVAHASLISSLDTEREWLEAVKRYQKSDADKRDEIGGEIAEISNRDNTLPISYAYVHKLLKRDLGE